MAQFCCQTCVDLFEFPQSDREGSQYCGICLGMSDVCFDDVLSMVTSAIKEYADYDGVGIDDVIVPDGLLVRERLLQKHLGRSDISISSQVRSTLRELVFKVLKANGIRIYSRNDKQWTEKKMLLRFVISNDEVDRDAMSLYPYKKRKKSGNLPHAFLDTVSEKVPNGERLRPPPTTPCQFQVSVIRGPLYVGGKYIKYARGLSQTPWFIGGVRKGETSVEELIANPMQKVLNVTEYKFRTAGREDIDVRMLGDGRPFALELINVKRIPSNGMLEEVTKLINSDPQARVRVESLVLGDDSLVEKIKLGENSKKKQYTCIIWSSQKITREDLAKLESFEDMELKQNTPIRVLHRRPALERSKMIHSLSSTLLNSHFFILRLVSSAGTYIKEFVNGDFGRTSPSIAELLGYEVEIIQLDVEQVIM